VAGVDLSVLLWRFHQNVSATPHQRIRLRMLLLGQSIVTSTSGQNN